MLEFTLTPNILGKWDKGRFDAIVNGLTPFLKSCGYNMKKEVTFLPVAALYGHNIKERVPKEMCDWCDTGSMFEVSYQVLIGVIEAIRFR